MNLYIWRTEDKDSEDPLCIAYAETLELARAEVITCIVRDYNKEFTAPELSRAVREALIAYHRWRAQLPYDKSLEGWRPDDHYRYYEERYWRLLEQEPLLVTVPYALIAKE